MRRSAYWSGRDDPGAASAAGGSSGSARAAGFEAEAPLSRAGVIGGLFLELRRALKLSMPEVARRLDTSVGVVEALETGDVRRLPPWPETIRIVSDYTRLGGIDPLPMLEVIRSEMKAAEATLDLAPRSDAAINAQALINRLQEASRQAARAVNSGLPSASAAVRNVSLASLKAAALDVWRRPRTRREKIWLVISGMLAMAFVLALGDTRTAQTVASVLPSPLSDAVRGINDMLIRSVAPKREGLIWIDLADPRLRKSDKLHIERR